MKMIASGALALTLLALFLHPPLPASSQETPGASPTAFADLQLDTSNVLGLVEGNPSVSWHAVPNAAEYSLTGSVLVIEVNREDPFCTAPIETRTQTIPINAGVAASSTTFEIILPVLPASDTWFVSQVSLRLSATDAGGSVLGSDGANGTAESTCMEPTSTTTPAVKPQLPSTGLGLPPPKNANGTKLLLAAVGLALLALLPVAKALRRQ